jgi:acetylornithine/succinyldiaminopimelate/putrescine aminotransferase
LGHSNEYLTKAVTAQQVHHVSNLYFYSDPSGTRQLVVKTVWLTRSFFLQLRAEANEVAHENAQDTDNFLSMAH